MRTSPLEISSGVGSVVTEAGSTEFAPGATLSLLGCGVNGARVTCA